MSIPHRDWGKNKEKDVKANFIVGITLAALILMTASIVASSSSSPSPPAYYQQSAFGQTYPGVNGPIVLESRRDGNWNIFGVVPDARDRVTRLVTNPADDVHGSLSPDGTKLLFASNRDGDSEIFVQVLVGFRPPLQKLTDNNAVEEAPNWSPDGTEIVFASNRDGDMEIWKMPARVGAPQTQLTHNTLGDILPIWSPDGTRIAFVSNRDEGGGTEIYTMNNDGANPRRFTQHPNVDSWPSWSPDGTRIAFSSNRDGDYDIYVKRVDAPLLSPPEGPLTRSTLFDGQPSWSPDGTRIAYTARDGNNNNIRSIPAEGQVYLRSSTPHSVHDARDEFPHWSKAQPMIPSLPTSRVQDSDGDGIFDNIDEQPSIFSERFSDVPLGGRTSGSVARGQVLVEIEDLPNPEGVRVRGFTQAGFPGGPSPSYVTLDLCPPGTSIGGGGMMVTTIRPNFVEELTCSSLDQIVLQGTVPTTFVGHDGSTAKIDVPAPNAISFDPTTGTLTAGAGNIDRLNVIFVVGDVEQEPRPLPPGGSLVVNTIPPETTIDSATDDQGNPIQDGSRTPSQDIFFEFSSPDSDVSIIECSLDSKTWEHCTNGVVGYDNLAEGGHIFAARAKDGAGNVDPTPATRVWTVITPAEEQRPSSNTAPLT